ncbi:MAG: hypothetical protein L3J78_04755 [Thermoplasmata archaeon]|nr:hypothetical protein [Thermoplasmata archaeon]
MVAFPHPFRRTIEHVYLTDRGGTPLAHLSRSAVSDKDPDLIASMFAAIQNFMDDSFHSLGIGSVRSIELGDRHQIVFGRGHDLLLYVVYRGRESNRLEDRAIRQVHEVERRFAAVLKTWDGDTDRLRELRSYLEGDWELPSRETPYSPAEPAAVSTPR